MRQAIGSKRVTTYVEAIFENDLHTKRVLALGEVAMGAVRAGAVGIHIIGRALAGTRGEDKKHSVKKVDRLVGNEGIEIWELFSSWVPHVVAGRPEIWVAVDWTDFEPDRQATLVMSLVTSHGRTKPLLWKSFTTQELAGNRLASERMLLVRLKEVLPPTVKRVLILADRGFSDPARWLAIQEVGFDFITRIRANLMVTDAKGKTRAAVEWLAGNRTTTLKGALVTERRIAVGAFVTVKKPKMKEPWCIVSSLSDVPGSELVQRYSRRFTIEETFRDIKDLRFGMGLSSTRVSNTQRRDRLLLLSALAIDFLTILGAAGEAAGIDKYFKTNTSKKRQYSLFRQGCEYFDFLPNMKDERALPLLEKFSELLAQHPLRTEVLGIT